MNKGQQPDEAGVDRKCHVLLHYLALRLMAFGEKHLGKLDLKVIELAPWLWFAQRILMTQNFRHGTPRRSPSASAYRAAALEAT